MNNLGSFFENPKSPTKDLPEVGQRVRVICVKEMIYMGNSHNKESDWEYDGQGVHGMLFWEEIKDDDEKR